MPDERPAPPYPLNPVSRRVASPPIAEAAGWVSGREFSAARPLLDVAQAMPSYPPPPELTAHLAREVERAATAFYTDVAGIPELRSALAAHMSEDYGAAVEPRDVVVTAGCNQAFCAAITALAQPGDEVLLPLPYYFNHHMWLGLQGVQPRLLPFADARGGVPEPAAAAGALGPRTRAIVLVTPNNPTGAEYPPAVVEGFYELAREHGIALVMDETYKDFRADPAPPHGLFRDPHWRRTLVQLYSFSKAYSLTGYRVGSLIAGPELLAEAAKFLDCVSICPPRIGQSAALFGLTHLRRWRDGKAALMRERVAALEAAFADPRLRYELVTSGAYFAYVRHPFRGESSTAVARRLARESAVLCLPGSMFGPQQEDYLRFAFANLETSSIGTLVERLIESQG